MRPEWQHPLHLQGSWEGLIHKESQSQPPTRGPAPRPWTHKPHAWGQARAGSMAMDVHAVSTQGPGQAAHPWTSTPGPWTCTLCPLRSQGRLHTPRQAHQVRGHARSVHRGARAGCTPPDKHATSTDEQTCDKGSSLTSVCGASTRTSQGIITVLSNPRARSLFISLCV